jgi:hypothetical protein
MIRRASRVGIVTVAVVVGITLPSVPGQTGPWHSVAAPPVIRVVDLATNDLAYDPGHGRILASVPSREGAKGNSIVAINPSNGAVSPALFVGSEPNRLALSDDVTTLYVGLDGAAAVRVMDMTTLSAGPQFSLGSDPFTGPFFAEDVEVLPGASNAIAVSRRNQGFSPRHEGVAIYENGVQLPETTPDHTGSNVIEFSDSASTLYGYNNETTEFGFRTMEVDMSGVTVVGVVQNLITGFGVDIEFDSGNDWMYATSGRVIDPAASTLVGTISASGPVEPDSANGLVFYLTGFAPTLTLKAFDAETFVPRGSLTIDGVSGSPGSLIRWGSRGLAFRTTADQVFLISAGSPFSPGG